MGRVAQSGWILCVFAVLASALSPGEAAASAVAQGVALNPAAGCSNGNLDITLTTVGGVTKLAQASAEVDWNGVNPTRVWYMRRT